MEKIETMPEAKTTHSVSKEELHGVRTKQDIPENKQHDFKQAGDRWRGMSARE